MTAEEHRTIYLLGSLLVLLGSLLPTKSEPNLLRSLNAFWAPAPTSLCGGLLSRESNETEAGPVDGALDAAPIPPRPPRVRFA